MSRWPRLQYMSSVWAAPSLLCVIAVLQILRVLFFDLTPWKGGGFGMFASNDAPSARYLKLYLITPEGALPAVMPPFREASHVKSSPTADRLEQLADCLAEITWVRKPNQPARPLLEGQKKGNGESIVVCSSLRIELWRYVFDVENSQLLARKHLETTRLTSSVVAAAPASGQSVRASSHAE